MKKQTANPVRTQTGKIISRFALAALFFTSLSPAIAQDKLKLVAPPLQVKYIGVVDDQPLFQVDFTNDNNEPYVLTIKGEDGTLLYTQVVKDKTFSKKIKWDSPESEETKLIFTLSSDKEKQTQVFKINTSLREVRDVVITKL